MCDCPKKVESYIGPQCQYFVIRKKRLCRMTIKPGKHYCGEHEPQPKTEGGQDDTRIPCPNDPKHTCYASKLEKHLNICNARQQEQPDYIIHNVNSPSVLGECPRVPLAKTPLQKILQVIDKVNAIYDTYLKDTISILAEQPIHSAVLQEFNEAGRKESSLRHLRQASSLIHTVEKEDLVADNTVYVELGAGKGHLSYYAWHAWCQGSGSRVLLVDRASLRHKKDNKLKVNRSNGESSEANPNERPAAGRVQRVRADLAHLALARAPGARAAVALVGYAKHLCGVATDLALRCVTAPDVADRLRGLVVASCCHHRCERAAYPAADLLQELGIDADDFNTLLGIVSWATCGDGRSRDRRNLTERYPDRNSSARDSCTAGRDEEDVDDNPGINPANHIQNARKSLNPTRESENSLNVSANPEHSIVPNNEHCSQQTRQSNDDDSPELKCPNSSENRKAEFGTKSLNLSRDRREVIGRRAKALLDWGRVLYLKERGFDARLVYYVPTSVSLENVCIVAKKV